MAPHRIDDFLELADDIVPELVHPGYKYAGGDGAAVDTPDNLSNGVTEYDPIAIVGIGCRLPGEVKSAANLWDLLISKKSGHSRVPAERWNIDAFYHPNGNEKIGTMSMDSGYFIHEDLRQFENSFFGINNIEATFMDPQQRKLLEVVYECLESAGVPLDQVNGANIGTYVGSFTLDYWMMQTREPDYLHRYHATGMGTTILANRISHALNLRGPSFTLDTGCSASLYALHQACTALDAGECDAAIVAASNLLQSPEQQLGTMKAGVLSPTGTCHTFDETADGYGRADGLGALYIKKLSKAIADGDPIRSIIRGTAVNSNGKTPGISLPSQDGQEAVIRKAYAKAGLTNFDDTQYVECHGTGTPVGDPIEVEAVSRVFNRDVAAKGPLLIGSVKTNLGHSEAASGLSSIIKATLALENGLIPATIGVQNINPKIKVDEWAVQIVQENTRWPSSIRTGPPIRRISVNSFGYGGANSHAILDSASSYPSSAEDTSPQDLLHASSKFIIPLSASTSSALKIQAARLGSTNLEHVSVVDLAHTLGTRRSKLAERSFALVTQPTLKTDLQPHCFRTRGSGTYSKLPIGFVFTGQGAQWPQMGKELLEQFPCFRRSIQELDNVLSDLPERPFWTIQQALLDPKEISQINHVTRSQPVCTAVQIALVQLLAQWGIKPQGVIGHSSGEIGAAYAAGRLSAAQAIVVAFYRGYVVGKTETTTLGAMMAVSLGEDIAKAEINLLGLGGSIRVACVNSPESVTISGDAVGIDKWLSILAARGTFARKLNTDGRAYHSHHMAALGQEYQDLLEKRVGSLLLPMEFTEAMWVSSVHEEPVTGKILPSYWRKNLESPVRFSGALERLVKQTPIHLIEIGPHSALEMPIKQTCKKLGLSDAKFHYSSALSRGKDGIDCVLNLMGDLFLHGHDVSFTKINYVETAFATGKQGKVLTDLPPYPWTYDQILFNESRSSRELRNRKYGHHDLLGLQTLCGDGLVTTWRNTLRVKDVSWLASHRLGNDVVFPAAGYIAMAIESVCQVTGTTIADAPSFLLRHMNITKALPLSVEENDPGVEIFTTLRPMKLTGVSNSAKWYDFDVGSFENGKSTTHATGSISLEMAIPTSAKLFSKEKVNFQSSATRNWYNRFAQVGLNFGQEFQSLERIEIDRKKEVMQARSTVQYLTGGGVGHATQANYIIHPITIDAMLQTALIASSAGTISDLACMVPTAIETARFKAPSSVDTPCWFVDAVSQPVGPGSIQIAAELHDGQGQICGQFENVSAVAFQGIMVDQSSIDGRHPMMRVLWKPDVAKLTQSNAQGYSDYLTNATDKMLEMPLTKNLAKLATMAGLVAHLNPRVNILELGTPIPDFTRHLLRDVLRSETPYKQFGSYSRGYFTANGELFAEALESADSIADNFDKIQHQVEVTYDLIIFPNPFYQEEFAPERLNLVRSFLRPQGRVLGRLPAALEVPDMAKSAGLSTVQIPSGDASEALLLASRLKDRGGESDESIRRIVVVERGSNSAFKDFMVQALSAYFERLVERVTLSALTSGLVTPGTTIISTVELYEPLLATMSVPEMASLKIMTDNVENLLWITGGDQLSGVRPDFAMVSGFQRSLVLEQPSLKFYTFDIDQPDAHPQATIDNILAVLDELGSEEIRDCETVQKDGVAYLSRFVPEETMNETFRQKLGVRQALKPLGQVKPCRLTIKDLGQFDTLAFKPTASSSKELGPDLVEVDVKSIGLNAKDIFVYSGKVETRGATSSLECAGVVTRVGSAVSRLTAGDRVVVMAPGHFQTLESFPEWACAKLQDGEHYNVVSTLPLVFATALYALSDRANLREHESVLIHSGAGGVGIAAIQIAQLKGAEIFTTVSTEEKKNFLVNHFGIRRENIFNSRDASFLPGILGATNGKGVDVVLNSLTGDLLHDSWRACARFGRFVEIGQRDLTDAGRLDMQMFRRNVTFTAFDVSELCDTSNRSLSNTWQRLLKEVMTLYRSGQIEAFDPLRVFDVSEISQAFRHFSSKNRMGKIAVSFEKDQSLVQVLPSQYDSNFSDHKTYVLSGCLGGIGRSITKWMVRQGARKFVFIGRSGLDKEPARRLVHDLEDSGASCTVIRGDVGNYEDVQKCVEAVDGPVGGVIQAAMGLDEHIFTAMSNQSWHTSVNPKVHGTWNLHNAIKGRDSELDFFLMTSSVAGSVGTATESNYTSANSFLDNFAKHRRNQGLPATSIGLGMISEVGYLHENPEIEAVLLRKGIQPIKEDELLSIIDLTLSRPDHTLVGEAHILTGLETQGMKKLRQMGFEGTIPTLNDPRASILASSLDGESDAHSKKSDSGLPPALAQTLEAGGTNDDVLDTITAIIVARLANLILVRAEKIDAKVPLIKWGMDSMLGAEFRTWFFMAFAVDIPFLLLLGAEVTPQGLGEMTKKDMMAANRFVIA